jgi:hypothetical protein
MLLIVAPAIGQNCPPCGVANEVSSEIDSIPIFAPAAAYGVSVPETPVPQKVIDKKFVAVMGALGGAESLRFTTRKLVLDREFAAGAPWVTGVPSNQGAIAKYAGLYAAELLVAYELKKPHSWLPGDKLIRKLWWAYPAAMAGIHIKNGVGNIRTPAPSACPATECQSQ